ncbi:MAG: hypothetical protein WAN18_09585 [Candidatus Sulfotelmatobacter sp.]
MEVKPISGVRYLGCSGNLLIFSDNLAAGEKSKTDAQEQPARCSDTKEEETLSVIAA